MANPVAKYKYWAAADYDGYSEVSGNFWPDLRDEIDGWITAISNNANISGYLPSKIRDLDDATTSNAIGFCYEFANPDGGNIVYQSYAQSTTTRNTRLTIDFVDNTTNYGYGTGTTLAGEQHPWRSSGYNYGLFISYDTTNNEEFFIAGVYSGNSYSEQDTIFAAIRGVTGHWGIFTNDGSSNHLAWWSPQASAYKEDGVITPSINNVYMPLMSGPAGQSGVGSGKVFSAANPRVLNPSGWDTGTYFGQSPYSVYSTAAGGLEVIIGG